MKRGTKYFRLVGLGKALWSMQCHRFSLLYIFFCCFVMSIRDKIEEKGQDLQRGIWDQEEHCRFLKGVVLYGKDWKRVRQVIGTRREKQIQSHYQKYARRVARMVKKIKRRGSRHSPDPDLMAQTELYRRLFAREEATPTAPSQIRSMILCVCPPAPPSPRLERNIIIHDLQELPQELIHATEESVEGHQGPSEKRILCEDGYQKTLWSPRACSFVAALRE